VKLFGTAWGEEFVYPKAKAIELAKAANTPVLFTPVEIPLEVAEPITVGGHACCSGTEAGAHHGHQADRRRGATRRGGYRRRPK
jgi:hypothetical protein